MLCVSFSQRLLCSVSKGTFKTMHNEVPPLQIDPHSDRPIFDLIAFSVLEEDLVSVGGKGLY